MFTEFSFGFHAIRTGCRFQYTPHDTGFDLNSDCGNGGVGNRCSRTFSFRYVVIKTGCKCFIYPNMTPDSTGILAVVNAALRINVRGRSHLAFLVSKLFVNIQSLPS